MRRSLGTRIARLCGFVSVAGAIAFGATRWARGATVPPEARMPTGHPTPLVTRGERSVDRGRRRALLTSPGVVVIDSTWSVIAHDKCLTIPIRSDISYACGDLHLTYQLPTVRTYNETRAPRFVYRSDYATGELPIGALVTFDPTPGTPDSVTVTVTLGSGAVLGSRTYVGTAFGGGATQHVSIPVSTLPYEIGSQTGYTVTAVATYLASGTTQSVSGTGTFLGISADGDIGFYWGMLPADVEYIQPWPSASDPQPLYWMNGNGDQRVYTPVPGAGAVWAATAVDRPDTIKYDPTLGYVRYAPHGERMVFEGHGFHIQTIDRLGHATTMSYYGGAGYVALATITYPSPSGGLTYTFYCNVGCTEVDSVSVPSADGQPKVVHFTYADYGNIITITDPDATTRTLTLNGGPFAGALTQYVDQRGAITTFAYDSAGKLATAIVDTGSGHLNIATYFQASESQGMSVPMVPDSAYTVVVGPRTDVGDTNRYWVDQWGELTRARDPLGNQTVFGRGNATYPSLVTYDSLPNGQVLTATYDARGNLSSQTDSATAQGGIYATTNYRYDGVFDFVTHIDPPLHDSTSMTYDSSTGNLLTREDARGAVSLQTFGYGATGQLIQVVDAIGNSDSLIYDAINSDLAGARTPLGFWTMYYADTIGRDTLVTSPIDSAQTLLVRRRAVYDVMDRVTLRVDAAPAYGTAAAESVLVQTFYGSAGERDSVERSRGPDPASIGVLTSRTQYDNIGRAIKQIAPDGTYDSTVYDLAGNPVVTWTRMTDPSGNHGVLSRTFDAMNHLLSRIVPSIAYPAQTAANPPYWPYSDSAYSIPADTAVFTYDSRGHMLSANNGDAQIARSYDPNGTVAGETEVLRTWDSLSIGGSFSHTYNLTFTYDLDGHRTVLGMDSAMVGGAATQASVAYAYDSSTGWLTGITDTQGQTYHYGYDADGRIDTIAVPAFTELRTFDADGRLSGHVLANVGDRGDTSFADTLMRNAALTYDARGLVVAYQDLGRANVAATMTYSGLGQLTGMAYVYDYYLLGPDGEVAAPYQISVPVTQQWDPSGNLLWSSSRVINSGTGRVDSVLATDTSSDSYQAGTGRLTTSYALHTNSNTPNQSQDIQINWLNVFYDSAGNKTSTNNHRHVGPAVGPQQLYYAFDGALRKAATITPTSDTGTSDVEYYRYDALGRRVLARALRTCNPDTRAIPIPNLTTPPEWECLSSVIRRTVWDADRELIEIQQPGDAGQSAAALENDTAAVLDTVDAAGTTVDLSPYFGRAIYTSGLESDRPLALTRLAYARYLSGVLVGYPGVTVTPFWNFRRAADNGAFDGERRYCTSGGDCMTLWWKDGFSTVRPAQPNTEPVWHGRMIDDRRDPDDLYYCRGHYFDQTTQRLISEPSISAAGWDSACDVPSATARSWLAPAFAPPN
jgi:YD repeat-containing protein